MAFENFIFLVVGSICVLQIFFRRSMRDRVMNPEKRWLLLFFGLILLLVAFHDTEIVQSGISATWEFCRDVLN